MNYSDYQHRAATRRRILDSLLIQNDQSFIVGIGVFTMAQEPIKILALTFDDLVEEFGQRYGKGVYHAAGLYRGVYRNRLSSAQRIKDLREFSRSGKLAEEIDRVLEFHISPVVDRISEGGVTKTVTRLIDGLEIESVLVPMGHHKTLCISSQVGCRMGCSFCETARMGLMRNLSVEEIVGQVYQARVLENLDIKTIVFMGMGEPLDNLDNVAQAIRIISDQRGLDIAKRHITISTAGIPSGLQRLGDLNWPDLNLAISLNAPNDRIRSRIMPSNHGFPMGKIREALLAYPMKKRSIFFIEYVLLKGVNDSPDHARQLAEYLKPLKVKVNVIPYNPTSDAPYTRPSDEDVQQFIDGLVAEKVFVRRRRSKGMHVMAACGQLGNRRAKRIREPGKGG
jgi:23S rRNA (adenine2503-C2)-methyltransferase